jgi:DNA polymerase III subunit epsilon
MARDLIVVDLETSGLLPGTDTTVEVAWYNMSTGERDQFVPKHDVDYVLQYGNPTALDICQYRSRLADAPQEDRWDELHDVLSGNTLAGANPAFDAGFLGEMFVPNWHHRMADLENYFAGWEGIPPNELLGLEAICERLWVKNHAPHTAAGDRDATTKCFEIIFKDWGIKP